MSFLFKFGPKIQNFLFKVKLSTYDYFDNILRLSGILPSFRYYFDIYFTKCATNTYKHGLYQLPHELSNDLRLRILEN